MMYSKSRLKHSKKDFPIFAQSENRDLAYLDNAASTQTPACVLDAMNAYYKTSRANIHRGVYRLSERATEQYEHARKVTAQFIHAKLPEEIIFTRGTTDSLNMLAQMLSQKLNSGDEVVITEMEHHANLIPWQEWTKKCGATLKFMPVNENAELDMQAASRIINKKTKIVAATWVSNATGVVNPIRKLTQLAHSHGAYMIVDAAQAAGHKQIDVQKLDCDFLAFSGHKMFGPTGIGVLYGKKNLLAQLNPVVFGGDMVSEVTFERATWADIPERFEAGTPPIAEAIGLGVAIDYLQHSNRQETESYTTNLASEARKKLLQIPGIKLPGPKNKKLAPIVAFTITNVHPHDAASILARRNVAVRAGHHCTMPLLTKLGYQATIRASFQSYNTSEDVDKLIQGVKEAIKILAPQKKGSNS